MFYRVRVLVEKPLKIPCNQNTLPKTTLENNSENILKELCPSLWAGRYHFWPHPDPAVMHRTGELSLRSHRSFVTSTNGVWYQKIIPCRSRYPRCSFRPDTCRRYFRIIIRRNAVVNTIGCRGNDKKKPSEFERTRLSFSRTGIVLFGCFSSMSTVAV